MSYSRGPPFPNDTDFFSLLVERITPEDTYGPAPLRHRLLRFAFFFLGFPDSRMTEGGEGSPAKKDFGE